MNREQKIALILGFAVILVVGVLVSDHWSRARELELADAAEGDGGVVQQIPVAALPGPAEVVRESFALGDVGGSPAPSVPASDPAPPPSVPSEVVTITQGSSEPVSPLGSALDGAGAQPNWLSRFERLAQEAGRVLPEAARLDTTPELAASFEPVLHRPEPAASQPVRHIVAKNESLFAIAKRYYGDGGKWRRIAEANPGKVSESGGIREGVTLVIPGAEAPAGESPRSSPERNGPVERVIASAASQYTVKKNDSLSEIAQRLLGSSKRMGEIVAANRGRINDPDDIRVGMVLTIPSKS